MVFGSPRFSIDVPVCHYPLNLNSNPNEPRFQDKKGVVSEGEMGLSRVVVGPVEVTRTPSGEGTGTKCQRTDGVEVTDRE